MITDCFTKKNLSQETKTTAQEYRHLIEKPQLSGYLGNKSKHKGAKESKKAGETRGFGLVEMANLCYNLGDKLGNKHGGKPWEITRCQRKSEKALLF